MTFLNRLRHIKIVRKVLYAIIGLFTYPGFVLFNKLRIEGTENLQALPDQKVLFVSNHQTYFADVMALIHVFSAYKWRKQNKLGIPFYLLNPFTRVYFVAAEETMNGSLISRLFKLGGALTVKRTWRQGKTDVLRERDESDTQKIDEALLKSWIITFPQGTTKPFAPGRKGTAHIIKNNQPLVVPVVINGFWRAFNKTGLSFKKRGSNLCIRIKEPLKIDYSASVDEIMQQIMDSIEQSRSYMLKGKHHLMKISGK